MQCHAGDDRDMDVRRLLAGPSSITVANLPPAKPPARLSAAAYRRLAVRCRPPLRLDHAQLQPRRLQGRMQDVLHGDAPAALRRDLAAGVGIAVEAGEVRAADLDTQ